MYNFVISSLKDSCHGHTITDDLRIIKHNVLRKYISLKVQSVENQGKQILSKLEKTENNKLTYKKTY